MKRVVLSVILVLAACSWASAETSMWKARKGDSVIYLGGTCHVLRESDYPLPPEFEKAYRASQILVLEADLGQLNDPSVTRETVAKSRYDDGSTMDKHLSAKSYSQLAEYCKANDIPLTALNQFKVSIAMVSLTYMELVKLGIDQKGVDDFYYKLAKKDNKRIEGLESVEEQIDLIVSMADGNEDEFVSYSLKDIGNLKENFAELAAAWRKGDVVKLNELLIAELKTHESKEYKKLIIDRNTKWLPIILSYQNRPQTRLVLVGAGHLVGPDGLIEALRKKGYRVDKL